MFPAEMNRAIQGHHREAEEHRAAQADAFDVM
jgi:hypothetical protein